MTLSKKCSALDSNKGIFINIRPRLTPIHILLKIPYAIKKVGVLK